MAPNLIRPSSWGARLLCAGIAFGAAACSVRAVLAPFGEPVTTTGERFERRLAELWLEVLDRSPERAALLQPSHSNVGPATGWDSQSAPDRAEHAERIDAALERLRADFAPRELTPIQARWFARAERLLQRERARWVSDEPPRPHAWDGTATTAASFLAHLQPDRDVDDLRAWLSRLTALVAIVDEAAALVAARDGAARLARPTLDATLEHLTTLTSQAPSDPFLEPFEAAAGRLPQGASDPLVRRARELVRGQLRPAYERLARALEAERGRASEVSGAWRSPTTEAAWRQRLADASGEGYDADALHELGRAELVRLQEALAPLAPSGRSRADWFDLVRAGEGTGPAPRGPRELWATVQPHMGELVRGALPELPQVAGAHAWDRPRGRWSPLVRAAADGTRRAKFLAPNPAFTVTARWQREVQALRFGVPGRALFDELTARAPVPRLLALATEEAHAEGWSLYVAFAALESVPGLERDGGFARIASELVEAAALVVDTGLHGRRWSRAQALDLLRDETPLSAAAAEDLVLRISAEPGRAAIPFLGLVKLRGLERRAVLELGERFDRAAFLRALLDEGPLSPAELDALVERWVRAQDA